MRPADREEAQAWDKRKSREYIAALEGEFPNTAQALRNRMLDYELYAPSGLYGFVLELAVLVDAVDGR